MTTYLTTDDIQRFNERFVGPGQLRDFGLLDSATSRPQMTVLGEDAYPTLHEKAAALLHGLARNHPFIDRKQAHSMGRSGGEVAGSIPVTQTPSARP